MDDFVSTTMRYRVACYAGVILFALGCSSPEGNVTPPSNPPRPTAGPTATITPDRVNPGQIVAALGIDEDSCPVDVLRTFAEDTRVIYVIAQDSSVPRGSTVMIRLFHNGSEEVDTQTLIADRDYQDICIFFEFTYDPDDGFFRRGEYAAQFFVNEVLRDTVYFVVQ